jgi:DNA-binding transcriptional regulator of glucitol operon
MIKNYKLKTSIAFALVCFLMSFISVNAQITAYSRTVLTGLTYTDMTLATAGPLEMMQHLI